MKRIGLIGGLSWVSSVDYYRHINRLNAEKVGPGHSANVALVNVDIAQFDAALKQGDQEKAAGLLLSAAQDLERAGAEIVLMCSNGVHRFFDRIQASISKPMIHIADTVAQAMREQGIATAGLLGVKGTMEHGFYEARLAKNGLKMLTPDPGDRERIHAVIFEELINEKFTDESRTFYLEVIEKMAARGAEGFILGCTEIPLLVEQKDTKWPVFDTAWYHASGAVRAAFGE